MPSSDPSPRLQLAYEYGLKPFAIAVVFVLVALLWTFTLQHWIDYPFVFLFFGAIMGSAWFGGLIAGCIAVVLSSFLVTFFFIPPLYSITVAKESQSFLAAFILCATAMSIASSARKRAENAVRQARDQLETKVQERTAELERSNREIRESEQQLRLLTEAVPQQIWRADAHGSIEYVNPHLREYLGVPEKLLFGDRLFRGVNSQDALTVREAWTKALCSGNPLEVQARVGGRAEGYRWFLIRAFPQRSEDGQIARWYGIHIDIEDREREQQSLTVRQENLSRLSRNLSMSEVAASIAHELNQPLTALVSHAYACHDWAASDPPNLEKVRASSDKIVQESTRASLVVRRVRALLSGEELVRAESNLNLIVHDSARLLRDEAIRSGVTIELHLAEDLAHPEIDPVLIQQVLINASRNAIEAMSAGTGNHTLTISTEMDGAGTIVVTVRDTGPGISPRIIKDVFEPFFSTKKQGTGIGLAICRSIVEGHNGHIWARNQDSGGALLQFTIPIKA
jgi:PAS domain S-box-containing protein